MQPRVTLITNIIAPYRLPAFAELAKAVKLSVLFCARSSNAGLDWRFSRDDFPFDAQILGGPAWQLTLRGSPDNPGPVYYWSPNVLRALGRRRPDVVITGGYSMPSIYAGLYCRMTQKRLLLFSDGTAQSERNITVAQRLARAWLVPRSDGALAASRPALERFRALGVPAGRIFFAPHCTDLSPSAKPRSPSPAGPLRVLFVGRLVPRKGVDTLLRGVRLAEQMGADVELTVVGDGSEAAALRRLASDLQLEHVRFLGFLDRAALPAAFADAEVFVFPTRGDTFGIALLEAAQAGLALLSSPCAGAGEELVRDGKTGFLVDPRSAQQLAQRLVELDADRALCARLGKAAAEAASEYTPAQSAEGYKAAIFACLATVP